MRILIRTSGLVTALLFLCVGCQHPASKTTSSSGAATGVQITTLTNRLRVEVNGKLFTEYYYKDVPRPYCYPLIGPGDVAMTRKWPMETVPDEDHDHPHHRSLWFAHGDINGKDFWTEGPTKGKTVHVGFDQVKSGKDFAIIKSHNNWVAPDGTVTCTDDRTIRIYNTGSKNEQMLDYEITLHASNGELTFGDTKEGTMAIRMAETMKLKAKVGPGGHIVQSTGVKDQATWGKHADWCDYYGPVDGKIVGIAMFDHPSNPRHPTWWHVRDYGLFAANPFGQHDFESLPDKTAGNLKVPAGQSITFRYRIYLHEGDEVQGKVAEKYKAYAGTK